MSKPATNARARLDAWRGQGADRLDPVRFHFIDALEKRASHHQGEVRNLLDRKLSSLIDAYARDLKKVAKGRDATESPAVPAARDRGALGELLDRLTRHATERDARAVPSEAAPDTADFPTLATLDEFRQIWSQVRTQSQVRQSMKQAPAGAGPLNSSALVHRSIALMRELSPGYLQQFLSYVDDLAWIEQMNAGGMAPAKDVSPPASGRKRSRGKATAP